jgi:penicillin-binding protein 1C
MDRAASAIVADILADRNARARTFGMDSVLSTRGWSAVKTGTSKDMRDNWCIGFTTRYTVGVWVGNSGGESMWDVSGTTGAAPVWRAVVGYLGSQDLLAGGGSANHGDAPGVVRRAIRFDHDLEAARDELFMPGTDDAHVQRIAALTNHGDRNNGRISQPVDGTIVAIDPDIPPMRQKVTFRAANGDGTLRWFLDGKPVGAGISMEWTVWPGRHVLKLKDRSGQVVDQVTFEVRGADVKPLAVSVARR